MIRVKGLRKEYKNFKLDISMEVPEGRVTGLIGRNGAGKSTTIKSIIGLKRIDSGTIEILGKDCGDLTNADKEQIGVALSDSGFSFELNLKDVNIILKKTYSSYDEEFFLRMCSEQGLPLDKKMKEFSTGMKAKVRVLVAVSHDSKVLILDEPTAGLDVVARNEVLDILRDYMEKDPSRAMIITSHISSDLEGICDDLYFIEGGKVILHEDTDVILGNYGVLKVDENTYQKLDKAYIVSEIKEKYGYKCLTKERQFYKENYPDVVIENIGIDDVITFMLKRG